MPPLILRPTHRPVLAPRIPDPPRPTNLADFPRLAPPAAPGPVVFRVGTALFDRSIPVGFSTAYSKVHMAVLGESGSGKSSFLELLQRFKLMAGLGGLLIDPANDLADNTLAFVAHRYKIGDEAMAARCHVLTIDEDLRFRYDVGASLPLRSAVSRQQYVELLDACAERVLRAIVRRLSGTDLEVMNRFLPRAKAVIMACLIDHDGRGSHIGLSEAGALCNPNSPRFARHLNLVFPHLPEDQQDIFREIMAERVTQSVKDRWESTQNRFTRSLSPAVRLATGSGPSLDFKKAIANRQYIIVRAKQSGRVPPDATATMTGLLIEGFLAQKESEENVPPHLRVPSSLTIDEVGDYLSESLVFGLCNDRKQVLDITVGAQNCSRMCNDNVDLGDFVLSQCGSIVAFAQRMRKSREPVADRLFTGNIALTKEMHEVQRQRGHLVIQTPSFSVNGTRTLGTADGINWGQTKAQSRSDGTSTGKVKNWADVENEGEAVGGGQSSNEGDVTAAGSGWSYHPIIVNGMIVGNAPTFSTNNNGSASRQRGQNSMQTFQKGRSHMDGGGRTENVSHIKGHSISRMQGGSHTENASNSSGWGLSLNTSLVPNMVSEYEWTGRYIEGSASDQREMHQRWLHVLNTAECFMSVLGCPFAFPVKIDHVDELWSSPTLKWHATQIITRKIAAQHAYTFSPADVPCPGTCQHGAAAPREFEADEENPIA